LFWVGGAANVPLYGATIRREWVEVIGSAAGRLAEKRVFKRKKPTANEVIRFVDMF
jgi:hypothetical protein